MSDSECEMAQSVVLGFHLICHINYRRVGNDCTDKRSQIYSISTSKASSMTIAPSRMLSISMASRKCWNATILA